MLDKRFLSLQARLTRIGLDWHAETLIENSRRNRKKIDHSIDDLPRSDSDTKGLVISAGPSLHASAQLSLLAESNFSGVTIAIDGSYVKCLKAGITPDYVLTLDPHPTRIVRWFGDPNYLRHEQDDDYFARQDLDVDFREDSHENNQRNIELVDQNAKNTKLIIASTAPSSVVDRCEDAGFSFFWWIPLADDPESQGSLTSKMAEIADVPAMNTGGTVGTAAWIFATFFLELPDVAVIGMDLGYPIGTPYKNTQTYVELVRENGSENGIEKYFPEFTCPVSGDLYYSDPTYYWYRENLLQILESSSSTLQNCTGTGLLFGNNIVWRDLRDFIHS